MAVRTGGGNCKARGKKALCMDVLPVGLGGVKSIGALLVMAFGACLHNRFGALVWPWSVAAGNFMRRSMAVGTGGFSPARLG